MTSSPNTMVTDDQMPKSNTDLVPSTSRFRVFKDRADYNSTKFQNGKIYSISSATAGICYIGSTTNTLINRLRHHCHCYDAYRDTGNGKFSISSRKVLDYDDYRIQLIENYPCQNRDELWAREAYYILNTENCINDNIPGRSKKQYYQDNREKISETRRLDRKANPEKHRVWSLRTRTKNKHRNALRRKLARRDNPEKSRMEQRRFRVKHSERLRNKFYEMYHKDPQKFRDLARKYRLAHPDRVKGYNRKSHLKHKEERNEKARQYNMIHREEQLALKKEKIVCACGKEITRSNHAAHMKKDSHKRRMEAREKLASGHHVSESELNGAAVEHYCDVCNETFQRWERHLRSKRHQANAQKALTVVNSKDINDPTLSSSEYKTALNSMTRVQLVALLKTNGHKIGNVPKDNRRDPTKDHLVNYLVDQKFGNSESIDGSDPEEDRVATSDNAIPEDDIRDSGRTVICECGAEYSISMKERHLTGGVHRKNMERKIKHEEEIQNRLEALAGRVEITKPRTAVCYCGLIATTAMLRTAHMYTDRHLQNLKENQEYRDAHGLPLEMGMHVWLSTDALTRLRQRIYNLTVLDKTSIPEDHEMCPDGCGHVGKKTCCYSHRKNQHDGYLNELADWPMDHMNPDLIFAPPPPK